MARLVIKVQIKDGEYDYYPTEVEVNLPTETNPTTVSRLVPGMIRQALEEFTVKKAKQEAEAAIASMVVDRSINEP